MVRSSHPAVHPAPFAQGLGIAPPGLRMRGTPGAPGTRTALGLRLLQALFAAAAIATMSSAGPFSRVTAFRFFLPAAALQCVWSLALGMFDVYALLVGRSFRTRQALFIISVGDWIIGGLTFIVASTSAGVIFVLNDMAHCNRNPCPRFIAATVLVSLSLLALGPVCLLNLTGLVYKLQRP